MIKYIGSKRRLVPVIAPMAAAGAGGRALDLFSGTARVGVALKETGLHVTAVDSASYAHVLAETYVATDSAAVDRTELEEALSHLAGLPGQEGYVTEVFCGRARYFHPDNGRRIDAIRQAIEDEWAGSTLWPLLLTSLLEAADRVDSTTGLQMAFLKSLAPRALRPLELRPPELVAGEGEAVLGDATELAGAFGHFDVAYLDPPYNQHQYRGNYHVWETIVRWDAPAYYGVACKREDCRDPTTASPFNKRREMPAALAAVIGAVRADLLLVSYNDESWLTPAELVAVCRRRVEALGGGEVALIGLEQARYVGAQIGIHNPAGEKVGSVSHLRNTELLLAAGPGELVSRAVAAGLRGAEAAGLVAREIDGIAPITSPVSHL